MVAHRPRPQEPHRPPTLSPASAARNQTLASLVPPPRPDGHLTRSFCSRAQRPALRELGFSPFSLVRADRRLTLPRRGLRRRLRLLRRTSESYPPRRGAASRSDLIPAPPHTAHRRYDTAHRSRAALLYSPSPPSALDPHPSH